ncbi:DMT family transporter [Fervidobacterium islandicum]|uniref:DMT family transporter n=1 Tax=Fervidobacterium islandicum TaxID=2423 RepID=UPI003A5D24F9
MDALKVPQMAGLLWMSLRIILLGYERIAGNRISKGSPTFVAAWGFFFFSFLSFFPFFNTITWKILLNSLVSGTIYSISFSLYTYALGNEDASVIAPLYNLNAIFLVILAAMFLGEHFSVKRLLGALLMIYGVSFLKKGENVVISYKNIIKSKGAVAMIVASLLMAIGRIIDRKFTINLSPLGYSVGIYLVISAYILIYGVATGSRIPDYISLVKQKWLYLILGGICNAYSYVALLKAFNYFGVSVAEPLSMLSVFVTMFFAKIFLKEVIGIRLLAAILLFSGSILIY